MIPELPFEPAMELAGIFVGALSGGLAAVRKKFDVFGVLVLAWAAGLGGGLMRDVLIGAIPPVAIADWLFIVTALAGGVAMYFFHPRLERARRMIAVLDAGSLALFAVVGTIKGLQYDSGVVASIFVGTITGVGGGVLRDMLSAEVPAVLHHRELYAIPALVGAAATALLWERGLLTSGTSAVVVALVFALRLLAMRFHLNVPGPWQERPRLR